MFRPIVPSDRETVIALMKEFYHSPAVLHPVPEENFSKTVDLVLAGTPYADAYLFESDGKTAGYALTARTYSNEAGGLVLWLEEAYILPAFRGKGLGGAFLEFLAKDYPEEVARIRLEVSDENTDAVRLYRRAGYRDLDYRQMFLDFA